MIDLDKEGIGGSNQVLSPIPPNFIDMAINKVLYSQSKEKQQTVLDNENTIIQTPITHKQEAYQEEHPVNNQLKSNTTDKQSEVKYFKDSRGNEFKIENGVLYSKEWAKSKLKFRIINEKTGNVMNLDGKILQIFGWSRVDDVNEDISDDDINVDEVTEENVNV